MARAAAKSKTRRARPAEKPSTRAMRRDLLWGGALVALTLAAYSRALSCGFIWDDDHYVQGNDTLRSLDGLRRIWLEPGAVPQYYPLVHTTFWLEYHAWGLTAAGYHLVNVLLHALAAILLWRLLARLAVPGAWLAAALFCVHPVEVESVAWITERKNVLSAVLALAAILAYLRFSPPEAGPEERAAPQPRRWPWFDYALGLACFMAAVLAKTVTASVPAVLLVIFWWKRGRIGLRDVALLLPWFAFGLVLALVTVRMEIDTVGAKGRAWDLDFAERSLVAGRALWFYASKLAWPEGLNFFYPRWRLDTHDFAQWLYPLAGGGAIVGLWLAQRRLGRGPLAAVLIFAGVLVPALGFFDVYPFRYSFVADHFQYHASMALLALAAACAVTGWKQLARAESWLAPTSACAVLAVLAALSWQRTTIYQDQVTLFDDVLARDPQSWIGHNNRGALYLVQGDLPHAIEHLSAAASLYAENVEAHNNLAAALAEMGECRQAIGWLERALALDDLPASYTAITCNQLGWILATCVDETYRDPQRALAMAEKAVEIAPDRGAFRSTLGVALYRNGQWQPAIDALNESIRLREGGDSSDRFFLAMAYHQLGRDETARRWYAEGEKRRQSRESKSAEAKRFKAEAAHVLGLP